MTAAFGEAAAEASAGSYAGAGGIAATGCRGVTASANDAAEAVASPAAIVVTVGDDDGDESAMTVGALLGGGGWLPQRLSSTTWFCSSTQRCISGLRQPVRMERAVAARSGAATWVERRMRSWIRVSGGTLVSNQKAKGGYARIAYARYNCFDVIRPGFLHLRLWSCSNGPASDETLLVEDSGAIDACAISTEFGFDFDCAVKFATGKQHFLESSYLVFLQRPFNIRLSRLTSDSSIVGSLGQDKQTSRGIAGASGIFLRCPDDSTRAF